MQYLIETSEIYQTMNKRYNRQILLSEIGEKGQEKLNTARVLIVGVGGLGCPIATYLAGAGIGKIGLVDDDNVSLNNLHRQVLYTEEDIGKPKVYCASKRLKELNSLISIETYPTRLTQQNAKSLFTHYDIIIDGCDNITTRRLISDTCTSLHIPYIYAAIEAFNGQVAILCHPDGHATYHTLFPDNEKVSLSFRTEGVQNTTPGIIGCMAANEALKIICGYGTPLIDKLWSIDFKSLESHIISL